MHSRKCIYLLTIYISVFSQACKKSWLDVKHDQNQAIPEKIKDFRAILDNSLRMNNNVYAVGEIAADGHYVSNIAWNNASSNDARNAYTWSKTFPSSDIEVWLRTYMRVFYCNVVMDNLYKVKSTDDATKMQLSLLEGEALFHRAEAFWGLSQLFAQPYVASSSKTDLGIPLRLNSNVSEKSQRASVWETYNQILADLKRSAVVLPEEIVYKTRPSKPAAFGLLARTYLVMQEYDSALLYANKCLALYDTLLNFSNSTSPDQSNFGLFMPEVIFHNRLYTSGLSGFLTTNYLVDSSLFNSYDDNDLRKTRFFRKTGNNVFFKGNYNNNNTELFCGIATDEIYLIRAECNARKQNVQESLDDLNTLLAKRWSNNVAYQPITTTSSIDALDTILTERKKELILRNLRWSDLRRLNMEPRFQQTITRDVDGNLYTIEPNSYKYTFPIPNGVLINSEISQNPGW